MAAAGQQLGQQDAVVGDARLFSEHRDAPALRPVPERLLGDGEAGHPRADDHEPLPRLAASGRRTTITRRTRVQAPHRAHKGGGSLGFGRSVSPRRAAARDAERSDQLEASPPVLPAVRDRHRHGPERRGQVLIRPYGAHEDEHPRDQRVRREHGGDLGHERGPQPARAPGPCAAPEGQELQAERDEEGAAEGDVDVDERAARRPLAQRIDEEGQGGGDRAGQREQQDDHHAAEVPAAPTALAPARRSCAPHQAKRGSRARQDPAEDQARDEQRPVVEAHERRRLRLNEGKARDDGE